MLLDGMSISVMSGSLTDEAYWDGVWRRWHHHRRVTPKDHRYGRNGEFIKVMKRCVGQPTAPSVIELGGACSYRALSIGKWWKARVTIVDYSPVGVELTRELFALNRCDVELLCGDFFALDLARRFDIVMHFGVLEHFTDPEPLLKISANLLAPHGTLVFIMPNTEALGVHLWRLWSPADWRRHIHHSEEDIRRACAKLGLEVSAAFHFGPPMLQMSPSWERRGLVPVITGMLQQALNGIWVLTRHSLPGHRLVSKYRAFVARKHEESCVSHSA